MIALQIFGSIMLACLGALGLWIAANNLRWQNYGRDCLRVLAAGQFLFVFNRIAVLTDTISPHHAVVLSGMIGGVLLTIELNLIWMQYAHHRTIGHRQVKGEAWQT